MQHFPKVRLGLLRRHRLQKGRALQLEYTRGGGQELWLGKTWKIEHLGCCHVGKYHWEVATWEKPLEKYLTSLFEWTVSLGTSV